MSGRYERVNARDDEDGHTPSRTQRIPNSPPPSFHSRASSILSVDRDRDNNARQGRVDSALADAFDSGDDSDDEVDDTQRLVRGTPQSSSAAFTPSSSSSTSGQPAAAGGAPAVPARAPATVPPPGAASTPFRVYGGGIQSDGVFSNIMAKPERGEEKEEQPPTYEQAAADAAPPYWETTILGPGLGGLDEVYIDGMPVGSFFSFVWNGMISVSIQPLIGFLLTYLLHSSHAAKNGSRSGLGITLIQWGFYMKNSPGGSAGGSSDGYANPPDPNSHDFDPNNVGTGGGGGGGDSGSGSNAGIPGTEWMAYILMIVGWFVLIRALSDYIRARRHEQLVLQSPDRGLGVAIVAEGESPDRVV